MNMVNLSTNIFSNAVEIKEICNIQNKPFFGQKWLRSFSITQEYEWNANIKIDLLNIELKKDLFL